MNHLWPSAIQMLCWWSARSAGVCCCKSALKCFVTVCWQEHQGLPVAGRIPPGPSKLGAGWNGEELWWVMDKSSLEWGWDRWHQCVSYPTPPPFPGPDVAWINMDSHQQYHWQRSGLMHSGLTPRRPPSAKFPLWVTVYPTRVLLHRHRGI